MTNLKFRNLVKFNVFKSVLFPEVVENSSHDQVNVVFLSSVVISNGSLQLYNCPLVVKGLDKRIHNHPGLLVVSKKVSENYACPYPVNLFHHCKSGNKGLLAVEISTLMKCDLIVLNSFLVELIDSQLIVPFIFT